MRRRREVVMRVTVTKLGKFRRVEKVEAGQRQYDPENVGKLTRFLFLVLEGETRFGKTRCGESNTPYLTPTLVPPTSSRIHPIRV